MVIRESEHARELGHGVPVPQGIAGPNLGSIGRLEGLAASRERIGIGNRLGAG